MDRWSGMLAGAVLALGAGIAIAQDAPESLLPPGFDDPVPEPVSRPTARPTAAPAVPTTPGSGPVVQPLPDGAAAPTPLDLGSIDFTQLPSIEELEEMSPDELDDLLGLTPTFDIPPAARRSMAQVGVLGPSEGGFPTSSLAKQPASLVRAALAGTKGPMVSRWGHILLRRALASRLAAPDGMDPVEFATLRMAVLNSMGEHTAARALAQDVDTNNWNAELTTAALDAYIGTADLVGACPAVRLQAGERDDPQWVMLQSICRSYAGEGTRAGSELDRALRAEIAPRIDVLLAQRYAGAAGNGRRAVDIEWDDVEDLNPWRFAIANAVGEEIPESLRGELEPYYERALATGAMLPLGWRAAGADRAAREGILSAAAMVDLYSQIYANDGIDGEAAQNAVRLREAYVGETAAERLDAMRAVWGGNRASDYGRYVLTAYAAARFAPTEAYAEDAAPLIASMLAAGLDRDAAAWANFVSAESEAGALLSLARPGRSVATREAVDGFIDDDGSAEQRKSQFLIASLAGLGRIGQEDLSDFSDRLDVDLNRETAWSRKISAAARVRNPTLVAMLAGLGMQGSRWEQMTPLHLYHIVAALNRVGLGAEARMIAAEAVARG